MLAFLAVRRLKNLALIVLPYGAGLLVLPVLGPALGAADRAGLLAVAIAPALLAAPALATAMGGRMDRAGALLAGTIAASFVLIPTRAGAAGSAVQGAMFAFVAGATAISVIPMLPATVRTAVQRIGDAAFVLLLGVGIAGGPSLGPTSALAALAIFAVTVGVASLAARVAGIEPRSAIAGAGTRDPAVAVALAVTLGGPGAAGIPLYTAALVLLLGAVIVAANRRKAR